MAEHASDYARGEMDIAEQVSTFQLFNFMTKWGSLYIAALLTLITLWFCTPAGFMGGLATALVLVVAGTLFLREKKSVAAH